MAVPLTKRASDGNHSVRYNFSAKALLPQTQRA